MRSIKSFEKLNRIAEGSYGIVYRAKDLDSGEIVAIKKLKLEREREGFPVTSLREINSLMTLKHPHVVNLREMVVGEDLEGVFMVMDYGEHDLKTLLENLNEPLSLSEVKTILRQILEGVAFMHEHWTLHRDLKTSNLLFTNGGQVKIADFGLSRKYDSTCASDNSLTPVVVTLWYRAPELLLGQSDYSEAVDMWSVGCIFGELLLGQPLFPGQGEIDQLDKVSRVLGAFSATKHPHLSKLPHFAKLRRQTYPDRLDTMFKMLPPTGLKLLKGLLAVEPQNRTSAKAALEDEFFGEEPLPKDPKVFPTWPSMNEREPRRRDGNNTPVAPQRPQLQD